MSMIIIKLIVVLFCTYSICVAYRANFMFKCNHHFANECLEHIHKVHNELEQEWEEGYDHTPEEIEQAYSIPEITWYSESYSLNSIAILLLNPFTYNLWTPEKVKEYCINHNNNNNKNKGN